jgi:formate hydrogenlyase subunit 3/multisubunit Na+/H+ antiporter MnhD subunit
MLPAAILILSGSGSAAAAAARRPRIALALATYGTIAGALLLLAAGLVEVLAGGAPIRELPLPLPAAGGAIGIDALSAMFLVLIGLLAIPAAIFGAAYLPAHAAGRPIWPALALLPLLLASMAIVVTARNGLVLLFGWEAMSLTSWLLVGFDHERGEVRLAARRYLIASFLGGACLLACVAILGRGPQGLSFAGMAAEAAAAGPGRQALVLALALAGFGTKAGLVPLHVWLPLAHPAAPSHVSSLMSGVMIKCGIYGLLRIQTLLPAPSWGFGLALLLLGALTALAGIATAVGQRDLKRALAYSSIENVGVITVGLGIAAMAAALEQPLVAATAATGALLHVLCHMLIKGMLFLGAGAVQHATHTRDLERMGGLLARMPRTGSAFLVGAAAIAALPPFCGFVGEWLILSAGFSAVFSFPTASAVAVLLAGLLLVLAGALAAAGFARLVGVAFLGQPRSEAAAAARDGGPGLVLPPLALAAACLLTGVLPELLVAVVQPAVAQITRTAFASGPPALWIASGISRGALVLLALFAILLLLRRVLAADTAPLRAGTWGCGYARPGPALQYTASSFAQPLLGIFGGLLGARTNTRAARGLFPREVASATEVPDRVDELWSAGFARIGRRLAIARRFQSGKLTSYLLLILATLVAGLLFAILSGRFGRT